VNRIRREGPLRSADLEGSDGGGWWKHKPAKKVALALWSRGDLAVRERKNFLRSFDLTSRVIPEEFRRRRVSRERGMRELLLLALSGHGWAQTGTLARTWRFNNLTRELERRMQELADAGEIISCRLQTGGGKSLGGWIRPGDLELAEKLAAARPRSDAGVLLSPFDPVLWDRSRVRLLFGFEQLLEIFKPAPMRKYGYYCLPVLAGETLVGRVDLKAGRARETLTVLHRSLEQPEKPEYKRALDTGLERYARALGLGLTEG